MAPIPLVLSFTRPFLFFVLSPFKPRTFIKKVSCQELRGWRPNTGMKIGQEIQGGGEGVQSGRGNWRKKFFTACGTRPSRISAVLISPYWSTILTLSPPHPHLFAVQSCDPFAHAEADVLYDCGVGCTGNNYASVKRDAIPAMEGPQRERSL